MSTTVTATTTISYASVVAKKYVEPAAPPQPSDALPTDAPAGNGTDNGNHKAGNPRKKRIQLFVPFTLQSPEAERADNSTTTTATTSATTTRATSPVSDSPARQDGKRATTTWASVAAKNSVALPLKAQPQPELAQDGIISGVPKPQTVTVTTKPAAISYATVAASAAAAPQPLLSSAGVAEAGRKPASAAAAAATAAKRPSVDNILNRSLAIYTRRRGPGPAGVMAKLNNALREHFGGCDVVESVELDQSRGSLVAQTIEGYTAQDLVRTQQWWEKAVPHRGFAPMKQEYLLTIHGITLRDSKAATLEHVDFVANKAFTWDGISAQDEPIYSANLITTSARTCCALLTFKTRGAAESVQKLASALGKKCSASKIVVKRRGGGTCGGCGYPGHNSADCKSLYQCEPCQSRIETKKLHDSYLYMD